MGRILLVFFSIVVALSLHAAAAVLAPNTGYYYELIVSDRELKKLSAPNLNRFQDYVSQQTEVDPYYLIEHQSEIFARKNFKLEIYEQILRESIGKIRPINKLETALMEYHLAGHDAETEFCAFTLRRFFRRVAVVESQLQRGLVTCHKAADRVRELRKAGWIVESHIHNHPFLFSNPHGDIAGAVLPSDPDVDWHLRWKAEFGLKTGIITNGFSTFEYRIGDITPASHYKR